LWLQPRGRFLDILRDDDLALIVASVRALGGVDCWLSSPCVMFTPVKKTARTVWHRS
jgi:hypothetical protein